jgi:two-component system, LytTR family, sensor kinase
VRGKRYVCGMNTRNKRHLLFWGAYTLFEAYIEFAWIRKDYPQFSPISCFMRALLGEASLVLFIKIPLVYLAFRLLESYAAKRVHTVVLFFASIGLLAWGAWTARALIGFALLPYIYQNTTFNDTFGFFQILNATMDLIFVAGVAVALKQFSITAQMRAREQTLIQEKLETELHFLKNQINPHFLFNTLNNIYSLARRKSDQTPTVVSKLSKLLRFMLNEAQASYISIEQEVNFLKNYLELEKLRYDNRLDLRFTHEVANWEMPITPLVLVPLVENAFKHGASESTEKAYIHIHLGTEGDQLLFSVNNSFDFEAQQSHPQGIGLRNLRRRLELTYPTFELHTKLEEHCHNARLLIQIPSYSSNGHH